MARVEENSTFLRPWLNAMMTALSTLAVSIETLGISPLACEKLNSALPRKGETTTESAMEIYIQGERIDNLSQNSHHESDPFK